MCSYVKVLTNKTKSNNNYNIYQVTDISYNYFQSVLSDKRFLCVTFGNFINQKSIDNRCR